MRICVLGSGSSGNSVYVAAGGVDLLIDAGLSRKMLRKHLEMLKGSLDDIDGILLSHEHSDHVRSLESLSGNGGIPVYLNRATASALAERGIRVGPIKVFKTGAVFSVGPLTVESFPVPHDALDPVGFIISDGVTQVGIATDLGEASGEVRRRLRGCRAVVIESNHDLSLLLNGPRPFSLKQRIRGGRGHLSNDLASALLREVVTENLTDVFLAHLSRECNTPELALSTAKRAIGESGHHGISVRLTYHNRISDVVEYRSREAAAGLRD